MYCYIRIIFLFLLVIVLGCDIDKKVKQLGNDSNVIIECDAEQWEGERFIDKSGKYKLSNANGRSNEVKRSGEYSLKLVKETPYGMTIVLDNVKPDDYFQITVWQRGKGHICASDDISDGFYKAISDPINTDSLGWEKLSLEFYLPYNYKTSKLKILLCNFGNDPVFFDDFKIVQEREKVFPSYSNKDVLNIFISEKNYQKLSIKRKDAFNEGLLTTAEDDWVKAIIFYKDQVLDTKLRLKGDRLDHLRGKKWSFRIKIKGDKSWKGMKTFSIQTPSARNFLHEWFFHKALEDEDILCTRYGFVPVIVNGQSLGVYAWEEHFEKQLLESRKRREGPILKLSDDSYWINDKIRRQKEVDYRIPSYDASVITPFNQKNYLEDSLLMNEFKCGRDLYDQYKYARGFTSDIFDVKAIAKYYAMADATNAYHTLHFFNQRFYYNPVIGKLEPIFFDSFADVGVFDFDGFDLTIGNVENAWLSVHLKLFADSRFKNLYFQYLKKYSNRKFWEDLYNQNKNEVESLNGILNQEFKNYNFDINVFYEIAEKARVSMNKMQQLSEQKDLFNKFDDRNLTMDQSYSGKADMEVLPYLVNIYNMGNRKFRVENYTTDTIEVVGFSDIPQVESERLKDVVEVPPLNSGDNFIVDVQGNDDGIKYVFINVREKKITIPIIPWGPPSKKMKYQYLSRSFDPGYLKENGIAQILNDTILFSGDVVIKNHLVIPANWSVVFEHGASLDLVNRAAFISYSPIFVRGTENEPVVFNSSDHTGQGINVFQSAKRSKVKHAVFKGLTNMDFGGWVTTGAVCFYESDVDFQNVTFMNNYNCDDALNVVRSDYLVENCIFEQTFSDALDSDFCSGEIISTQFLSPGNDAIDFSGSTVFIKDCKVINSGDKGISCGEKSTISIAGCSIDGGNIGIASKDNSEVRVENSKISNVTYGLVAFCKKPEYGSASIYSKDLIIKKYLFIHLIEEGSKLSFNNREIFGQEKDLAKRFY